MSRLQVPLACRTLALVLLLAGAVGVGSALAQEEQVPIDRDSTLYVVDAELRGDLGLFPEVTGFEDATLFRIAEDEYELVIRYREQGRVLRKRRTLTAQEVRELRTQISERMKETGTVPSSSQEGRYGLLASTTYLGLTEGALLAGAMDADEQGAGALTLLGATGGFFIPLFATSDARVTEGEADMTFYGTTQGFAHGVQLVGMLADDDADARATVGMAALFGAVESTAGYLVARTNTWSGGHAEMVSLTGLSGNLLGLGFASGLADDPTARGLSAGAFVGSLAGAGIGHSLGRSDRYTQGDARVYVLSGVQAANLVGSAFSAGDAESERGVILATATAGVAGLASGTLLVRNRDFTKTQGSLVLLGSIAGSVAGGGFASLVDAASDGAVLLQALGSAAGFGITYGVFSSDARRAAEGTASLDLNFNVTPSTATIPTPRGRVSTSDRIVPKVTLTARF